MKFRLFLVIVMTTVFTVGLFVTPSHAKQEPHFAVEGPMAKLGRGIINTATGWTELFLQPAKKGAKGIITGPAYTVGRTVVGPVEVATFLLPNDKEGNYGPLIKPATPFSGSADSGYSTKTNTQKKPQTD